jgi:hypothetical protein
MIGAEWQALVCEHNATNADARAAIEALRLAAEFRRQLLLLDRDLAQTTRKPPQQPPQQPKTLAQHLAAKEAARQ